MCWLKSHCANKICIIKKCYSKRIERNSRNISAAGRTWKQCSRTINSRSCFCHTGKYMLISLLLNRFTCGLWCRGGKLSRNDYTERSNLFWLGFLRARAFANIITNLRWLTRGRSVGDALLAVYDQWSVIT